MIRIIVILAAALATPAMAQDGPSFDCAKAGSSAEEMVCADPALAALDREMAATYRAALDVAEGMDAGAEEAVGTLKAMQRGWIGGRDECWKAADERACVAVAYQRRTAELVATWMLREPYTEAAWSCGFNEANEVFVMYFDTELPSIRVEYGDGIEAMVSAPSGSGARYDGSFGRFFWEKGGAAQFAWIEGEEQACELVAG